MNHYLEIDHVGITFPTDSGPLNVLNDVNQITPAVHFSADFTISANGPPLGSFT